MTSKLPTTWSPLNILSPKPHHNAPFAIVILNQELKLPLYIYHRLWQNSTFTIAADGGANRLYNLNSTIHSSTSPPQSNNSRSLPLNAIIGDLDSLLPSVRAHYTSLNIPIIEDSDQYSTDFTKAVKYIRAQKGMDRIDIVVLGGLGGRVDQAMSVVHHLYLFQEGEGYGEGRVYLVSNEAVTFVLKRGRHEIRAKKRFTIPSPHLVFTPPKDGANGTGGVGEERGTIALGKHVGILPLKGESIISTAGLEWDVKDWKTVFGGLVSTSNHVKQEFVCIDTSEDVLFTVDLDFGDGR